MIATTVTGLPALLIILIVLGIFIYGIYALVQRAGGKH